MQRPGHGSEGRKALRLSRFIAFLATLTLAVSVLLRSPGEYRTLVCIVVTLAAIGLGLVMIFRGKPAWAIPFLGVLCIFTPFQIGQFSHLFVSILDMACLALFALWPMILRHSAANGAHVAAHSSK